MAHLLRVATILVGFWWGLVAQAPPAPSLQELYERHRWFALRDAIAGQTAPALYSGAVAAAFNRTGDAERDLNRAVREAATIDAANEAREALINLYVRVGRSSDMIRILDEALAAAPSRADFRNARGLFESFRRIPNQTVRMGRSKPFRCTVGAGGVHLPLVINGKAVEWLFDSAFSHAAMSESEARMLGVLAQSATGVATDFAGATATTRAAVADRIAIGDAELRNVPVLVFPDSQPPWNDQPPGKRGAIGVPVAVALQAIGWTAGGTCQVGPNQTRAARPDVNMAFDGVTPVTRVLFEGTLLEMVLDTGNQGGTQLWERFARDFPVRVREGRASTRRVSQIGGSTDQPVVVVPEMRLRVGGFDSVLQPANVFSKSIGDDLHHGNLGIDVLGQAAAVTIDFQAMSLTVR